jgi:hypothetical protein
LLVTDSGFQECVGGHVVMQEPVVVAPELGPFRYTVSLELLKMSQQKSGLYCRVRRNKLTVNNTFTLKIKTMNMLFVELRTCRAFFFFGDSGLFHRDDYCFVSGS